MYNQTTSNITGLWYVSHHLVPVPAHGIPTCLRSKLLSGTSRCEP